MNYKYLKDLERNLEIQAHSYLLQKEDVLFESQTRTELNQVCLVNRLKPHIGQIKKFYLADMNFYAKILEVCTDHIVVEESNFNYLIKINQILGVNNLDLINSKLAKFEEKWNFKSNLRKLMIEKKSLNIRTVNQKHFTGKLSNFFSDHIDLSTNSEILTLQIDAIQWVKYRSE